MRTAREVPTPWDCRNTMISRMAFWSAQPEVILSTRLGPMPLSSSKRSGSLSMTSNTSSPKAVTSFRAKCGPMPLIIPLPRYFSMPSTEVGGITLRKAVLN
jgi:hypothetical protein